MSVISFPRRVDTRRRNDRNGSARPRATHRAGAPRRRAVGRQWRGASTTRKSVIIVLFALTAALAGTMVQASRQIEIHSLQSQLLLAQSTYAVQAGSLTNLSAPSQIVNRAGALHLVDPTSVSQIPSTSLATALPLPKFLGSAPAISRTRR